MTDEISKQEGIALWRQAMAAARPVSVATVSALDLAAWLDGQANERLTVRVEAAVAADPALLDMVLAAVAATSDIDDQASERLTVRARALVAPQIKPVARSFGWLGGVSRWRRQAEWAMVGLSIMVAAAAGLWIGNGVSDTVAPSQTASISLFGDDGGGLLSLTEDL